MGKSLQSTILPDQFPLNNINKCSFPTQTVSSSVTIAAVARAWPERASSTTWWLCVSSGFRLSAPSIPCTSCCFPDALHHGYLYKWLCSPVWPIWQTLPVTWSSSHFLELLFAKFHIKQNGFKKMIIWIPNCIHNIWISSYINIVINIVTNTHLTSQYNLCWTNRTVLLPSQSGCWGCSDAVLSSRTVLSYGAYQSISSWWRVLITTSPFVSWKTLTMFRYKVIWWTASRAPK